MRTLALIPALTAGLLLLTAAPARADDPLLCVDIGQVDVGPYSYDPPRVCVL